jgi:hypothetical protein
MEAAISSALSHPNIMLVGQLPERVHRRLQSVCHDLCNTG